MAADPAFPFYASDWLGSTRIALMDADQERGLLRLLCHLWATDDCALPDDDEKLSRLSLLREGWFEGKGAAVRECLVPHPTKPGFVTNAKLLGLRREREEWRRKSAEGGRKSGESRRAAKKMRTKGEPHPQPNANTPSPSSLPLPSPSPESVASATETRPNGRSSALFEGVHDPKQRRAADVQAVIDHYRIRHPRSNPGKAERAKIAARLDEGSTVVDLKAAIDGAHLSPFHNGVNDAGTKYLGLTTILRDADQVTKFIETAEHPPAALSAQSRRTQSAIDQYVAEGGDHAD